MFMNPRYRHVTVKNAELIVRDFRRVVEEHYRDSELDLATLASRMDMSERQLQRKLKKSSGQSPSEFLRNYRLSRSLELILSGESIHDTALAVGFSSQAYFASCFKAQYGRTPTEYRELGKAADRP